MQHSWAKVFGVSPAGSGAEEEQARLWEGLYREEGAQDRCPERTRSLHLPASISGEIARTTLIEFQSQISAGSEQTRQFLDQQYQRILPSLKRRWLKEGCALGTGIFKPWFGDGKILVDFVGPGGFCPTEIDGAGQVTGGIFGDYLVRGRDRFLRLEYHSLKSGGIYQIRNRAFQGDSPGREIPLASVPEWADLQEELTLSGIDRPLFSVFRYPNAGTRRSAAWGNSCYGDAVELILQSEDQWRRILWEYEGSELALDVPADLLRQTRGRFHMPAGKERLYRAYDFDPDSGREMPIKVFSPEIRDSSLFRGLNEMFKRIEFQCGLSYGILSDPQTVEMTATEIKASKQRFHSTVKSVQDQLESALQQLAYGMGVWAAYAYQYPAEKVQAVSHFEDSILTDQETRRQLMLQDVREGILPKWMYAMTYYHLTEEEAKQITGGERTDDGYMGFSGGGAG